MGKSQISAIEDHLRLVGICTFGIWENLRLPEDGLWIKHLLDICNNLRLFLQVSTV
jgi:hypothetical protein